MIKVIAALLFSLNASAAIHLTTLNSVLFKGEVGQEVTSAAAKQLAQLVEKRGKDSYTIYLVMDSPGGDIEIGEDFIQLVKTVPNLETITFFAASMGSAIVQALPGKRHVVENGTFMYHRARGAVSGQFETGELESRLGLYKTIVRKMEERNAARMGMPLILYKRAAKDELWHYGSDAVAYGSADVVSDVTCSKQLIEATQSFNLDLGFISIKLQHSQCPLIKQITPSSDQPEDSIKFYNSMKKNRALKYITE